MDEEMNPNEAAASLAFATHLQDGMMMAESEQMPESPQGEEMAQDGMKTEEAPEDTAEDKTAEIEAMVDAKVEEKMNALKEELSSALAEDDDDTEEED